MANKQNDELHVHVFTDESVLRRSEKSITSLKILKSGRAVISKLIREKILKSETPFPNVEKLCFLNGYFNNDITRFIAAFKKLKSLEFDLTTVENPKCIELYFPTLKHLTVLNNLCLDDGHIFSVANVKQAILLNPQLEGIKFRCDAFHQVTWDDTRSNASEVIQLLRFVNERLQHLNYLGIHFSVDNYNNLPHPIVFKNVTKAMLYVEAYNFKWGPTSINFPVAFQQLIELEISSYDMYTDDCIDFAMKNQLLEKLKLKFHWLSESDDEEDTLAYDILYEEDDNNEQIEGETVEDEGGDEDDEEYEDYDKEEDDDEEDDERIQYECNLEPFIKLTKSLTNLKELSIGPISKFDGEEVVKILSPGKSLNKLHIKLRYPLHHRRSARYAGVKKIEQQIELVKNNIGAEDWACQVEFKFTSGSESKFRVANFVFQRIDHFND